MNQQTSSTVPGIPPAFLNRFGNSLTGVLSGFDRLRLRGTLRHLFQPTVMEAYLNARRVLIKDFGAFAQALTTRVKAAAYATAEQAGRPFRYWPHAQTSKEDLARQIARTDGVSSGLIAIFSALENCLSYSVRGDRQSKQIHLVLEPRKCLHLYHYFLHEQLGLCHVRVQTWFPFTVDICLNGRDRLARQMDAAGLAYRQRDNCFVWVADALRAPALLDDQLRTDWPHVLGRLLDQAHPLRAEICRPIGQTYYWTASASEYATDLLFRDAPSLAALYPRLVHHGLRSFASPDVMRFLGRKTPTTSGRVQGNFTGEVISDLKHRPEGLRVKHSVNGNSVKIYDKEGSVLRIETTINKTEEFRVYRAKQGEPGGRKSWRPLQRSVGELWRRAQVSAAANRRYLEALASVTAKTPAGEAAAAVCRPVVRDGRRHRALNPWSEADAAQERRPATAVTRQLRLLRAHGLSRTVSGTHRYVVTENGRKIITALLAARAADVEQLTALAA
ncbi:MAG TPA: hypothetical protein VL486_13740 [Verrucomicrobiae bacterium]|nr:hypothetical protein [Verrucomicrobiae bacterium]